MSSQTLELRETHVSWVFVTEGEVFKIKKPVKLPFLDFSTLEARQRACEAELLLNTRLAVGAYLGLVPVRLDAEGRHHLGPRGEVVDWAVHMMRLPDAMRVRDDFAESDAAGEGSLSLEEAREVEERCQLDFLRDRARMFERRIRDGRIRDGHGDLRLDHLYVGDEGELTILECIEFSDRFRYADVCADVALGKGASGR